MSSSSADANGSLENHDGPKILMLTGYGRSGSTVIEHLLGGFTGVTSVGELRNGFFRGFVKNYLCGCGERFLSCPFWNRVTSSAFGSQGLSIGRWMASELRDLDRMRRYPEQRWPLLEGRRARDRRMELSQSIDAVYRAISALTHAELIVDTSKNPSYAFLMRETLGDRLRVVHLVRDARAVAHAWRKKVRRVEVPDEVAYLKRHSLAKSVGLWNVMNLMASSLRPHVRYLRLRYEDFVFDPEDSMHKLLTFGGIHVEREGIELGRLTAGRHHTVGGNPRKFSGERVILRLDDAWKTGLSASSKVFINLLAWPLLREYGYFSSDSTRTRSAQGADLRD